MTVAFHFHLSNQAGWKCDACRKSGLAKKRRCGWLHSEGPETAGTTIVWARKDVALTTCPKSFITGESETLLEEFFVHRRLGGPQASDLSARQVEAFAILETALAAERNDGTADRQ